MQKSDSSKKTVIIKKIKKSNHGGHHGGSWKVAYADFVTAMMAFFLVMWLVSAASKAQKDHLAGYFKEFTLFDYKGVSDLPGTSEQAPPEHQGSDVVGDSTLAINVMEETVNEEQIVNKIREHINDKIKELQDQITVEVFDKGVRIEARFSEDKPLFDTGNSFPTDVGTKILTEIGAGIKDLKNKIAIEGHTDAQIFSNGEYTNWELSVDRASVARKILIQSGVSPDRIDRVSGYASTRPIIKSDPNDPRNRRISILLYNENAQSID